MVRPIQLWWNQGSLQMIELTLTECPISLENNRTYG